MSREWAVRPYMGYRHRVHIHSWPPQPVVMNTNQQSEKKKNMLKYKAASSECMSGNVFRTLCVVWEGGDWNSPVPGLGCFLKPSDSGHLLR